MKVYGLNQSIHLFGHLHSAAKMSDNTTLD